MDSLCDCTDVDVLYLIGSDETLSLQIEWQRVCSRVSCQSCNNIKQPIEKYSYNNVDQPH
jgi:hypothetical protein